MKFDIGNYARHAPFWDWSNLDHDRAPQDEYWYQNAARYGRHVLLPMCALGETGAYMARRGLTATAFDLTPEMIAEGKKRFGDVQGLTLVAGDVCDFRFDIPPADFCFCVGFGHLLTLDAVKKALTCIHHHLREGGGLMIETTLPPSESSAYPLRTFMPKNQVFPGCKVWKTGEGRFDAQTGRHYIAQVVYCEEADGHIERFEHSFYLQSYPRETWLSALSECGFALIREYGDREADSWQKGDGFLGLEAVKRG